MNNLKIKNFIAGVIAYIAVCAIVVSLGLILLIPAGYCINYVFQIAFIFNGNTRFFNPLINYLVFGLGYWTILALILKDVNGYVNFNLLLRTGTILLILLVVIRFIIGA